MNNKRCGQRSVRETLMAVLAADENLFLSSVFDNCNIEIVDDKSLRHFVFRKCKIDVAI